MSWQSEAPWHTSIMVFSVLGAVQIVAESNDVPMKAFNFIRERITHNHCVINT